MMYLIGQTWILLLLAFLLGMGLGWIWRNMQYRKDGDARLSNK
jgi:hypothetical protein